MSATQRYHEFLQTLHSRRELLEEEYKKIQRQLEYFENAKSAYEIVNATKSIATCDAPIQLLSQKLEETKKALEQLDPLPLAHDAMDELVERHNELQDEFDKTWNKAKVAREAFMSELKQLSDIRRRSINLSHESSGIARTLRQNPLQEIYIGSNKHDFTIDVNEIL